MCLQANITDLDQTQIDQSVRHYNLGALAATSIFSCLFYVFMVGFCLRNILTIFYTQKNKNPLLIVFYSTSLVCVISALVGFFDYSVLDLILRSNSHIT